MPNAFITHESMHTSFSKVRMNWHGKNLRCDEARFITRKMCLYREIYMNGKKYCLLYSKV